MGFFGKIKNILFEDEEDDDIGGMPVYTKDDVKVNNKKEFHDETEEIELPPIRANANTRFKNVKRDIDFDENDVLGEVPGHSDIDKKIEEEEKTSLKESSLNDSQKSSPFLTFDEDEFERLNAHPSRNDRPKKEIRNIGVPVNNNVNIARQANGNFSSTTAPTTNESKRSDGARYNVNSGTLINGKKPFTPSPVLSPVYGILDKNYKKEEIRDRKEIRLTSSYAHENLDVDEVRKRAYGNLADDLEDEFKDTSKEVNIVEYDDLEEEEDSALLDLSEDHDTPEVKKVTVGDALEYFEDLGLEYNVDYVDASKERTTPKREKDNYDDSLHEENDESLVVLDEVSSDDEEKSPSIVQIEDESNNDEDSVDDDNLFDLIDSMYQEKD